MHGINVRSLQSVLVLGDLSLVTFFESQILLCGTIGFRYIVFFVVAGIFNDNFESSVEE